MTRLIFLALGLATCARAGDPLADINVLKTVHFVMKDGTVFKSSTAERLP
jgi:hypothetical protein